MKVLTIKTLIIQNFKGINHLKLVFNEDLTEIVGDNRAGKTTIVDAWSWLFTDKNSQAKLANNFSIKPLNEKNEVLHKLITSVEAEIVITDGQETRNHRLKKEYSEVWSRPRGQIEEVLTSHKTAHFIDNLELEIQKKDYEKAINNLTENFNILTNLSYFNEKLKWDERREILFNLIDKTSLEAVKISNKELLEEIKSSSLEAVEKITEQDLKPLKKRLQEINPIIVSYKEKMTNFADKKGVEVALNDLNNSIAEKEKGLSSLMNNENAKKIASYKEEIDKLKSSKDKEIELVTKEISLDLKEKIRLTTELNELKLRHEYLKKEHDKSNGKVLSIAQKIGDNCPTCLQHLPKSAKNICLKNYTEKTESEIKDIRKTALQNKSRIDEVKRRLTLIEKKTVELSNKKDSISEIYEKEISILENEKKDLEAVKSSDKETEIEKLKQSIENKKKASIEWQERLDEAKRNLEYQSNIKELEEEYKEKGQKLILLENKLSELKEVKRLIALSNQDKINSLFKNSKFKLFEVQMNGEIKEVCETLIDGVPYVDANREAQINANVEMLELLSMYYNVQLPIFIDNSEGVTKTYEQTINNQTVRLKALSKEDIDLLKEKEALEAIKSLDKAAEIEKLKQSIESDNATILSYDDKNIIYLKGV